MTNLERFFALRERLYKMISDYFESGDGYCKSYEGNFTISSDYGNYFDDPKAERGLPCSVTVHLDVYVVGPRRHYEFSGETLGEALDELESALNEWEELEE